MPKALTEIYIYILLWQTDQMMEGQYPVDHRSVVLKLAQLVFHQLANAQANFYEAHLKECGMDVKEGWRKTVQEFLAAVHAHHAYLQ